MHIHKPGKKYSNIPFGNPKNPMQVHWLSSTRLITTEIWNENLHQKMSFGENGPYKLEMHWEVGKCMPLLKFWMERMT